MRQDWIRTSLAVLVASSLIACVTDKEKLLPHGESTMQDIWDRYGSAATDGRSASRRLLDARRALRRPLSESNPLAEQDGFEAYTRTAKNEIDSLFRRLPNPDMVMYVFPHLAGSESAPVPGYSTVFPLYVRVPYAMPGERTDDY
jgi:conjugative transfer region lipoprotein (TIGR03751 family)